MAELSYEGTCNKQRCVNSFQPDVREYATVLTKLSGETYLWRDESINWHKSRVITAGIDSGASNTKALVLADGKILTYGNLYVSAYKDDVAMEALCAVLKHTGMDITDIRYIIGTGRGETGSIVKKTMSDISCHIRGVNYIVGSDVRTVLITGGQDCAAVHCNGNGRPIEFVINACRPAACRDNLCNGCGAAQGSALEVVADSLGVAIEEIGPMSLNVDDNELARRLAVPLDKRGQIKDEVLDEIARECVKQGGAPPVGGALGVVCASLARTQARALLRNGWPKEDILAVYNASMAHQAALLVQRLGMRPEFVITGGVAKNMGVVRRLEKELGIKAIIPKTDPQVTAALGAALIAADLL